MFSILFSSNNSSLLFRFPTEQHDGDYTQHFDVVDFDSYDSVEILFMPRVTLVSLTGSYISLACSNASCAT